MDARITQALEITTELEAVLLSVDTNRTSSLFAKLQDGEDRIFSLIFDGFGNEGRIKIAGDYPRIGLHHWSRNDAPTITVSQKRTAASIAADITRRFYPKFTNEWEWAAERKQAHDEKVQMVREAVTEVWEVLELRPAHNETFTRPEDMDTSAPRFFSRYTAISGHLTMSTYPETHIRIEHLSLTVKQAVQLAQILDKGEIIK